MKQFNDIVDRLRNPVTASSTPLAKCPDIRLPINDTECNELREWAQNTPPMVPPPATPDQLAKHLQFVAAVLPSKNVDDTTGKMRLAVYASLLGSYSNEALAFMAKRACQTLEWFPTPKQCLELLAEYQPPMSGPDQARQLCADYTAAKFDVWIAALADGAPIGDVAEHWKRIAVERGLARRLQDGSYVSRALYQGPYKAYVPQHARAEQGGDNVA